MQDDHHDYDLFYDHDHGHDRSHNHDRSRDLFLVGDNLSNSLEEVK